MNSLRFPNLCDAMAQQIAASMQQRLAGIDQRQLAGQQLGLQHQQAAALASQPSDEREGPKVGETWERGDGEAVTLQATRKCGCFTCSEGYFALSPSCNDAHIKKPEFRLIRRLSAPSADKWEPALGQEVEGVAFVEGRGTVRGEVTRLASEYYGDSINNAPRVGPMVRDEDGNEWTLDPETVRPATPSPKAAEGTVEKVVVKADPYAEHRRELEYGSGAEFSNVPTLDQRIASAKAQRLADLDRKLPERGKWDWDVADADELRVT